MNNTLVNNILMNNTLMNNTLVNNNLVNNTLVNNTLVNNILMNNTLMNNTLVNNTLVNNNLVNNILGNNSLVNNILENITLVNNSIVNNILGNNSVAIHSNHTSLQVIYGNKLEQVLSICFILSFALFCLLGQGSVLLTIWKTPTLHESHFKMIVCCCISDIVQITLITPNLLQMFVRGASEWYCKNPIMNAIALLLFYVSNLKVVLFSYERYVFFIDPFKYESKFTKSKLVLYEFLIMLVPGLFVVVSYSKFELEYHASALMCSFPLIKELFYIQYGIFLCPTVFVTVYCAIRILRLIRKSKTGTENTQPNDAQESLARQVKKAIRVMFLVSGTFWFAVIPGFILRLISIYNGVTWEEMDGRTNMAASLMMRISTLVLVYVPPAVNPWLYFFTRKDLRNATKKLLGLSVAETNQ